MVLDFGKVYFLKNIQIEIIQCDSGLKEFFLLIKNNIGEWENTGKYIFKPYNNKMGIQVFNVGKEPQIIKMELLNTWELSLEIIF